MLQGEPQISPIQPQEPRTQDLLHKLSSLSHTASEKARLGIERTRQWGRTHITEKDLYREIDAISGFIDLYRFSDRSGATRQIQNAFESFQKYGSETARNELQSKLVGYLFAQNRNFFEADKGSLEHYDMSREKRQIEGVLRALHGDHLHMGTGEGKSSVVIPVASLVEAATTDRRDIIVSSSNWTLLEELKGNTQRFGEALSRLSCFREGVEYADLRYGAKKEDDGKKTETKEKLKTQMEREAIVEGSYSEKLVQELKNSHWEQMLAPENSQTQETLRKRPVHKDQPLTPRILFASEKDLVFQYMEDKDAFRRECPKIFMDEAHTAFDRNTPYQNINETVYKSPQAVRQATHDWLMYYMVGQQIQPTDMEPALGSHYLTDEGSKKLERIDLGQIRNDIRDGVVSNSWTEAFMKGVDLMAAQRGIDITSDQPKILQEFLLKMADGFCSEFGLGDPQREQETKGYAAAIGNQIGQMMHEREKMFTIGSNGNIVVRDAYIDELLSEHKYDPEVQLAATAIVGKFEVVTKGQANKTVRFPSFVNAVADRITCFSGTLLYPDPLTGKIKKGAFANFLEAHTFRKARLVTPPEVKRVPRPQMVETVADSQKAMLDKLADIQHQPEKPTLLIDFNGLDSTKMAYEEAVRRFGKDSVYLLPPKPTGNLVEEQAYKKELDRVTRALADGTIRMVVSSGSAGTGINIAHADGTFPDLRVALLGMPESEQQLVQAIGRRRLSDISGQERFYWIMSKEGLSEYTTLYEEMSGKHKLHLGDYGESRQQKEEYVERVKDDPEKLLRTLLDFMHKKQASMSESNDFVIRYDTWFDTFSSQCRYELSRRIRRDYMHLPDKPVIFDRVELASEINARLEGVPEEDILLALPQEIRTSLASRFGESVEQTEIDSAAQTIIGRIHLKMKPIPLSPQERSRLIETEIAKLDFLEKLSERDSYRLQKLTEHLGLPSSLYWDLLSRRLFMPQFTNTVSTDRARTDLITLETFVTSHFTPDLPDAQMFRENKGIGKTIGSKVESIVGTPPSFTDEQPIVELMDLWYEANIQEAGSFVELMYGDVLKQVYTSEGKQKGSVLTRLHTYQPTREDLGHMVGLFGEQDKGRLKAFGYTVNGYDVLLLYDTFSRRFFQPALAVGDQSIGFPESERRLHTVEMNPLEGVSVMGQPLYLMDLDKPESTPPK